jgi:hypothetical protein
VEIEFGPPLRFAPHAPRLQRRTRVRQTQALRSSHAAKRLICGDVRWRLPVRMRIRHPVEEGHVHSLAAKGQACSARPPAASPAPDLCHEPRAYPAADGKMGSTARSLCCMYARVEQSGRASLGSVPAAERTAAMYAMRRVVGVCAKDNMGLSTPSSGLHVMRPRSHSEGDGGRRPDAARTHSVHTPRHPVSITLAVVRPG